jgi:hypothetical protein
MYEDASQPPKGASQPSDTDERLSGLMSLARKRQAESEAALTRAADAEAELAAARQELAEVRELLASDATPYMDPNRAPKTRTQPEPMAALKDASWEQFGFETPRRR